MKISFFTIVLIFAVSCGQVNKRPGDILSQEKMRQVMWDLIRTDVYVSDFLTKDSTINRDSSRLKMYEQVYRLHATSKESFKKSLAYYQSHPDLLKAITDSLRADERRSNEERNIQIKTPADTTHLTNPKAIIKKITLKGQ
jgi:hypothetical protein